MSLIDHHIGIVLASQAHNLGQIGDVALHGEHAIGNDELHGLGVAARQLMLQRGHITMPILARRREGEAAPLDDGGVVEFITDDVVFTSCHTRHYTEIGLKTRGVYHHILLAHPTCQLMLQLQMEVDSAIEEARACTPCAILARSLNRGLYHSRMIGET